MLQLVAERINTSLTTKSKMEQLNNSILLGREEAGGIQEWMMVY